jgi:hypothetical protein
MINKLISAATLFAAGSILVGTAPTLGAAPVATSGSGAAALVAGNCSASEKQDVKPADGKPAGTKDAAKAKAKDGKCGKGGSCGKGTCGSKDKKASAKKDASCGKDKKDAAAKKDGSCGADKK